MLPVNVNPSTVTFDTTVAPSSPPALVAGSASKSTVSAGPAGVRASGLAGSRGSTPAWAPLSVISFVIATPPVFGCSMPKRPGPTCTVSPLAVRPAACAIVRHAVSGVAPHVAVSAPVVATYAVFAA